MATAASHSVDISRSNHSPVPDHDVARLMYYLNCVTVSVDFDILQDDLVDYFNYHLYSESADRIELLFNSAGKFSPDCFIDKLLFRDDAGKVVPPGRSNEFANVKAARDVVSIRRKFVLAGRVMDVTKVMFFRSSWLSTFYHGPIKRIADIISGPKHSECPKGECHCATAPRGLDSESTTNQHQADCDECGWQNFTGPRFNCNLCDDYDLCDGCYKANKHIDTRHRFSRYERPGDSPVSLPVRSVASSTRPPPPPPPPQAATRTNTTNTTTTKPAPVPPPHPAASPFNELDSMPLSSAPNANPAASTFFYQSMSVSELKAFLEERDVDVDVDTLNIEALCRRVWETHCDCMSIYELKAFLSSKAISTVGCKSINDRREKAKAAFEPPLKPPVATNTGGSGGWRKDDIVVFTGMRKADLNGKVGKILFVDSDAERVTVWVDDLRRALKANYENLAPYVGPQATASTTPGRESRNVPKTNQPPPPCTHTTPDQPASSTVTAKARGIIYSESGGRFVATFMIEDIQYIFAGAYNPNPGTYRVNRATLEYDSKRELTGTRPLTGTVGISKVKLKIGNGPVASGDLPIDNYVEPASTIGGSGTWSTA